MQTKVKVILIFSAVLLTGCLQYHPIEELSIINTRGVDILEEDDNQIETTLMILQFDSQTEDISRIVSGKGTTIKGARDDANLRTSFALRPGQINLEMYGKETAEKGILRYTNTLVRDARVSDSMFLAISDPTAKELITVGQKVTNLNVGQFIQGIIEQQIDNGSIPRVALHDFSHKYFDIGQDPVLPVISLKDDLPSIVTLGVFQDDRYIGDIPIKDAFLINVFERTIRSTPIVVKIPVEPFKPYLENVNQENAEDSIQTKIRASKGKSNTKLVDEQRLKFQTNLDLEVYLLELTQEINIKDDHVLSLIEKELETTIKNRYEELLEKLQEMKSDPFGYGNIYKAQGGSIEKGEWREKFPDIEVDFKVNVTIIQYGTMQ